MTQHTYKGKTAGGWLKNVEISEMKAGNYEITTPDLPNDHTLAMCTFDNGNHALTINNFDGVTAVLLLSDQAEAKLQRLEDEKERLYQRQEV